MQLHFFEATDIQNQSLLNPIDNDKHPYFILGAHGHIRLYLYVYILSVSYRLYFNYILKGIIMGTEKRLMFFLYPKRESKIVVAKPLEDSVLEG